MPSVTGAGVELELSLSKLFVGFCLSTHGLPKIDGPASPKNGYTNQLSTIISLSLDIILPLKTVSPNHTGACVYTSGPQFLVNDYLNWKNLKWRCYGLILGLQDCLVVLLVLSWVSYITHLVLTTKSCYVT